MPRYRWDPPPLPPHRYEWRLIEVGEPYALMCVGCGDVKQTSWEAPDSVVSPPTIFVPVPRLGSPEIEYVPSNAEINARSHA